MWLLVYLAMDTEKLIILTVRQFQKDLLGTYFVESETRTKLELSVEMSNKTVQN